MRHPLSILTALRAGKYLFLIGLLLQALSPALAQQVDPMFYKEVQLPRRTYTLHALTREIQKQSGLTFSYDAVKIDPDRTVKLGRSNSHFTVQQLLILVRRKTGVGYKVVSDKHIIYTPSGRKQRRSKPPPKLKKAPPVKKQAPPPVPAPADEPEEETADEPYVAVLREDSSFSQQVIVVGDSMLAMSYYASGAGGGGGAYGGYTDRQAAKYPTMTEPEEEAAGNGKRSAYGSAYSTPLGQTATVAYLKRSSFIAAGFSADESYYFNPTLRAGFSFLYGTIAYNLGNFAHWRYGLGTSAKLGERWTGHLEWNTGNTIAQRYTITSMDTFQPPPVDSIPQPPVITESNRPLLVQSRLNRFTFAVEWDMGRGFGLGGGLTLNLLKTTYYSNGNAVALRDVLPVGYDADKKYKTITPPYVFSNGYSADSPSHNKMWIGVQLRFVYRLHFFER